MEALKDWAIMLAGIVVLGSASEVILPDSSFRKYVRLAIALVLMLTLLSPLKNLLYRKPEFQIPQISQAAYRQREEMEATQKEDVMRLYSIRLNEKIEQALIQRIGKIPIDIQCRIEEDDPDRFGTIRHVLVLVDAEYGNNITDGIKESLYQDFGINKNRIDVRYLKESNQ